jgi:lipopolysaccharide transport system ATP-binding protein
MSQDSVISVERVSKAYRMWNSPSSRLTAPLLEGAGGVMGGSAAQWLRDRAARSYRDFFALQDVSLHVEPGESVGIVGRNGSGKSTLLQIIAGTLQPTAGSVQVKGRVAALLELGAGFNPDFTGRENIFLSGAVLGLSQGEIEARFDEITAFADIGDFVEQPAKTYSSGMLMRLAFAVNTCVDPDILIVDEALSVGDAPFQAKCFRRLRQLIDKGVSLLFVSHDIGTVRSICSRALWLKNGRAEMWGEAKQVAREYEKFCWAEQGVVLETEAAPAGATLDSANPAPATVSSQELPSPNAQGDFSVPTESVAPPAALLNPPAPFARGTDASRYGTGAVTITNLLCTNPQGEVTRHFDFNDVITLNYLITLNRDIDSDIVIGIRIKDPKENFLFSAQDIVNQHRINARAGAQLYARTSFRLPLTHGQFLIKTGIFGFTDGQSRVNGKYDYGRAVLWDIIEDGCEIEIDTYPTMPLCGPVHAHADLLVMPLPAHSPSNP